ncbi:MAG TPA: S8 family serine peptidase [Tepidisphaeraceae bacterium]|nr:S8 family serine peptidase [Tepidisphaeraceae bacterium]
MSMLTGRRRRGGRYRASVSAHAPVQPLERRVVMSAAFDITGLTDLRDDPNLSGVDGSGVAVAVLDTGVFAPHPDLQSNVVAYYNAVTTPIPGAIDGTSVNLARDFVGHGTHVAGTVASSNPKVGVAPAAKIVSVKVIPDVGEQQLGGDALLRGLEFVQRFADQFNIRAVNMSLAAVTVNGGLNLNAVPPADDISRAIDDLEDMGVTVVTASGNSYANDPVPGAGYPAVMSTVNVASTWSDSGPAHDFGGLNGGSAFDNFFAFENSAAPDRFSATSQRSTLGNQVAAPGVDILSTWNGPQLAYNTISGTSMAAPFVSGVVALMQDAAQTYGGRYIDDPGTVLDILQDTADVIVDSEVPDNGRVEVINGVPVLPELDLPETGEAFFRVNARRAVLRVRQLVTGGTPTPGTDVDKTRSTATVLPPLTGTRSLIRRGNIGTDGSIDVGPNDIDLFRLNLQTRGDLGISLSLPGTGIPFTGSLRLFDDNGVEIARADAAAGPQGVVYPALRTDTNNPLPTGLYYVGVSSLSNVAYDVVGGSGASGGQSEGDYFLTVALGNPDSNGSAQGALPVDLTLPDTLAFGSQPSNRYDLTLGTDANPLGGDPVAVPHGDVDMFKVVAPDNGTLRVRTLGVSLYGAGGADTYVKLFDAALAELANSAGQLQIGGDRDVTAAVTQGETYYVAVTAYDNRTFSPNDPFGRVTNSTATPARYDTYLSFHNGDADGIALAPTQGTVGQAAAGRVGTDGGTQVGAGAGAKDVDFISYSTGADGLLDVSVAPGGGMEASLALWAFDFGTARIVRIAEATGATPRLVNRVGPGQTLYVSVTGRGNQNFNWFARASGAGGQTGDYTLNSGLRPLGDLAALSDGAIEGGTPGTLEVGTTGVFGTVGMDGPLVVDADVDLYRFVAPSTGRFDFRTDTSQEEAADTVLRVFDVTGVPLVANDNASATTSASAVRVDLVAGQTYYVGVSGAAGAQSTNYDARTGANAVAGSHGTYSLTAAPAPAGAPAVSVSDAPTVAEQYRVGSSATFTISLDNPSATPITVAYATTNGTATGGADFTAASGTVVFAPGEASKTVTVPVTADVTLEEAETMYLDVSVAEGPNAAVGDDRGAAMITNQGVTTLGLGGRSRVTLTDADGTPVLITLKGPGGGEVILIGDTARDVAAINVSGTTAASTLTIVGGTTVGEINVNGGLRSLGGRGYDVGGNVNVSGPLGRLQVRSAGGGRTITVGPGGALTATFGNVSDLRLVSASPIRSLRTNAWQDTGGDVDVIQAPAVMVLQSRGDFAADVTADAIGKVTVGGTLLNSDIRSAGNIASVRAGASSGSRVFAGVRGDVATLPDGLDDFANGAATLGSLQIGGRGGGAFSDTRVAAGSIGRVLLGAVTSANGGNPFGIAADTIRSITAGTLRLANLGTPEQSQAQGDFIVWVL